MTETRADSWSDSWLTASEARALRAEEAERAHPTYPHTFAH